MSTDTLSSNPASAPTSVARAATIVMAAFVLSRVLGLVRTMVIGARFGTADSYAAYVAAFKFPDLIFNLLAGGVLASAFLPVFTQYLTRNEQVAGWRLASAVANWLLIVLGVVAGLAAIVAPWVARYFITPGYADDPEMLRLTANLMRFMLLSTVIFSLSGLSMSILHAFDHFLTPALAPVLYNFGIIFGAIFLTPSMGIYGLATGVVLGAVGHMLIQFPMLRRYGVRYSPLLGTQDSAISGSVRRVAKLMGPRVMGAGVVQLMFISNTIIASFYAPGVLPALDYAWLIMLLPHGVFASSIATAVFPTFSRMVALGDRAGMQQGLARTLRAVLFVTLPSAAGLVVLREPIVQLLFERGNFTAETTTAVAWALGFYGLGLVGHSFIEIITRAYYALQDTWTPVIYGVLAMTTNIVLSLILIPIVSDPDSLTRGPQGALALANAFASTLEMVILLWLMRNKLGGLQGRSLLRNGSRMGIATASMAGGLWLLMHWQLFAALPYYIGTPLAIMLGALLYLGLCWLLRVEESRLVPQILLRRIR